MLDLNAIRKLAAYRRPQTNNPRPQASLKENDMDNSKQPWQSKTLWAAGIVAAVPLIPGVGPVVSAFIAANPAAFSAILGAIFAGLRAVTNGSVSIS